jgi:hypothetical protein
MPEIHIDLTFPPNIKSSNLNTTFPLPGGYNPVPIHSVDYIHDPILKRHKMEP